LAGRVRRHRVGACETGGRGVVAQKVLDALAQPFKLDAYDTYVSASIGITLFPADGDNPESLVMNADTAMYRAKEQGRNTYSTSPAR